MEDIFWFNNPKILIKQLDMLYPKKGYSTIQNLNAIVRLFILVGIITCLFTGNILHLLFSVSVGLILTYIIYSSSIEHFTNSDEDDNEEGFTLPENTKLDDHGNICQLPTKNNPFGNMIPGDDPTRLPVCRQSDNETKTLTEKYFKLGLYNDVNDVWDKNNSQREYFTKPATTIPNDRDSWAQWCFNAPYSCRDGDMDYCLRTASILNP